jgi:hypothetical protein
MATMSATALSFCEPVTATSISPWHIRSRPATEPLKPGGGITTPALCGRDLHYGWDIPIIEVTDETVQRMLARDDDGRTGLCQGCVDALRTQ